MSKFELRLPQMGESVAEATLTSWLKEVGDRIELDEAVVEIATDKVDSEVPSEVEGVLLEKRFQVDEVIQVGEVIAIIETDGGTEIPSFEPQQEELSAVSNGSAEIVEETAEISQSLEEEVELVKEQAQPVYTHSANSDRFYSPLVRNMAREEGISETELATIPGTGSEGRVTKEDMMQYINSKKGGTTEVRFEAPAAPDSLSSASKPAPVSASTPATPTASSASLSHGDEIIPLTRMGKLIAHHMRESVQTSAHVQSFVEVDVTKVVEWRNKVKKVFEQREGEKLTFTPIFMEAVAMALRKYPMMNISLEGESVIKKRRINLGMAAALPDGNLIVPVIKNADQLNLVGMAKAVNDLARRARNNDLKPDEVKDGTYTVTNVGSFGSIFGTPIINQPQVGILALGAIRKIPSVIETEEGDFIGIRSKMYLSHSYDHRVVNGALGGQFVKAVADYLEAWDSEREF